MTIHETAAKLAAVNARIAHMAQTSNDECIRMAARIQELETALNRATRMIESAYADTLNIGYKVGATKLRDILAKGN